MFYANSENARRPPPILAWAHPTTGVTRDCSPTRRTDVFNKIPGIEALVRSGFAVIATDYAGFASIDPHPYLVGESHARSVLDAVRAVRQFRKFRSSNRFAVWGHSQGGHAALWTGELQPIYAPELELVGVAAAAPATQLADLFRSNVGSIWGNALTAMALHAWSHVYNIPASTVIHPAATPAYRRLARDCLMSLSDVLKILRDERPLEKGPFFLRNPTEVPVWRQIMDINSPGQWPIAAPVLIAQGRRDGIVPHHITKRFAADRCASGSRIHYVDLPRTDHMYAAEHSAHYTVAWIKARFAGQHANRLC
jgi:pimeloyl-ACP methyl ester carboxylesterase